MFKNVALLPRPILPIGNGQSVFHAPAKPQTAHDVVWANSKNLGPVLDAECLAVMSEKSVRTFVAALLCGCGPTTVARLVMAVIVRVAVQGVFGTRAFAHVFQETLERVSPTFTDTNPSAAIVVISPGRRRVATALHLSPDRVERVPLASFRVAMFMQAFSLSLTMKTPTTLRPATAKAAGIDNGFCSARAETMPVGDAGFCVGVSHYGPTTEGGAGQILEISAAFHAAIVLSKHNGG